MQSVDALYRHSGSMEKQYAVNSVPYKQADAPLKLADYFNTGGVFSLNSIPTSTRPSLPFRLKSTAADFPASIEIVKPKLEEILFNLDTLPDSLSYHCSF